MQSVRDAWTHAVQSLIEAEKEITVRPESAEKVITFSPPEGSPHALLATWDPVVFRAPLDVRKVVPGRELVVVIQGNLMIDLLGEKWDASRLRARRFRTTMAYFRVVKGAVDHVLGVHYDVDSERVSHPRYHVQFCSFAGDFAVARQCFPDLPAVVPQDWMEHVPQTVRIPTTHHDPLSAMLQLFADHLLSDRAPETRIRRFTQALHHHKALLGPHPAVPSTVECVRSWAWYANSTV